MGRGPKRASLAALAWLLMAAAPGAPVLPVFPAVRESQKLAFPLDHGAHPDYRTEWWYVTGWLKTEDGRDLGFQVTFFRSRLSVDQRNPSAFSAKQVLFAHAGLSDPKVGALQHDGRMARQGFGLAQATIGDADVVIDDWRLTRGADNRFRTHITAADFTLDLAFSPSQPILLQGDQGFSRKGPQPSQASHYYSLPHLKVSGTVIQGRKRLKVTGEAWLDHEWSSTLLDPKAVGWDWVGLNLEGGEALTAFRVRDAAGQTLWAGGSIRAANGSATGLGPSDVRFTTERVWRSPRTGGRYPVERELIVRTAAGERRWRLVPLFDDQELDSRRTGGPVYWEGAVRTQGGRGYLELTGYVSPLKM